jgi:hypothetical protein
MLEKFTLFCNSKFAADFSPKDVNHPDSLKPCQATFHTETKIGLKGDFYNPEAFVSDIRQCVGCPKHPHKFALRKRYC